MFPRKLKIALLALVIASGSFAATSGAQAAQNPTADIINGTEVPSGSTDWDFIVALLSSSNPLSQFCGGTLIQPQWVLTAAHCVDGGNPSYVMANRKSLSGGTGNSIAVDARISHPDYDPDLVRNDIALLHLALPVSGAGTTLPMATAVDNPPDFGALPPGGLGASVAIAGWGNMSQTGDDYPLDLRETTVEVVSNAVCAGIYGSVYIVASNLCAAHFEGIDDSASRDTCQGDSGGPLVYNSPSGKRLVGVTSWGEGCAESPFPGVYTRVSSYLGWVSDVTGASGLPSHSTLDFGTVATAGGSSTRSVTLTSTGSESLEITGISIGGGDFALIGDTCNGSTLVPGASCAAEIRFTPQATGTRSSHLIFTTNSASKPNITVALVGHGSGSAALVAPGAFRLKAMKRATRTRGGKILTTLRTSFAVPAGVNPNLACIGRISLTIKVPRRRAASRAGGLIFSTQGCTATIAARLPAKFKRKRATVTMRFSGNGVLSAATRTAKLTIK